MSDLLPGENMIIKTHQHWIVLVKSLLIPVALLAIVAIADFTIFGPDFYYVPRLRTLLSLAVVGIALLWLIVVWIRWQTTVYTLTDQRIKIESGVSAATPRSFPSTASRTAPPGSRSSVASSVTAASRSTPPARPGPRCSLTCPTRAISATRCSCSRSGGAPGCLRPRTQAASKRFGRHWRSSVSWGQARRWSGASSPTTPTRLSSTSTS